MTILFSNRYSRVSGAPTGRLLGELADDLAVRGISVYEPRSADQYVDRPRSCWRRLLDDLRFYWFEGRRLWELRHLRAEWIVGMTDPPLLPLLVVILGQVMGCKTAVWMQDVYPEIAYRAGVLPWVLYWPLERLMRWALRRATVVVAVGRCMQQVLRDKGVRSTYIPNWVDGKKWPASRYHKDGPRVYAGRFGVVHGTPFTKLYLEASGVRFIGGVADAEFRQHASDAGIHMITLCDDMLGLSVPSKIYVALALDRDVEYLGPAASETYLLLVEAKRSQLSARAFFDRYCDRPIQTERWWTLLCRLMT